MLEVIEPPAAEPVTLLEVYDQLRLGVGITSHPDDVRLTRLIRVARQKIETITRRALITQTMRYTLNSCSRWAGAWGRCGELPKPMLLSVIAVQFYDDQNVLRSVDVANYRVIGLRAELGGRVEFVSGFSTPQAYQRSDAYSVVYTAGYPPGTGGAKPEDDLRANIPEPIRETMLLLIDQSYNARLPAEDMMMNERIGDMLETYRVPMS